MVSFTKINRPVELLGAAYYENSCYMIEDAVRAFGQKLLRTLGTRIMKYSAYGIRIRTFVTVGGAFVDCARTTHVRLQIIMLLFLHYNIYNTESFPLFYCERISRIRKYQTVRYKECIRLFKRIDPVLAQVSRF